MNGVDTRRVGQAFDLLVQAHELLAAPLEGMGGLERRDGDVWARARENAVVTALRRVEDAIRACRDYLERT